MRNKKVKRLRREMRENGWSLTRQGWRNAKKLCGKGRSLREAITELVRRDYNALERSKKKREEQETDGVTE